MSRHRKVEATASKVEIRLSEEEAAAARRLLSQLVGMEQAGLELPMHELAFAIQRARQERQLFFPGRLFADPGWDMLLSLYCAEGRGEKLSVTALGHAMGLPQTTTLRWIDSLAGAGLVERLRDQHDRRRSFLALTASANEKIALWLQSVVSLMRSILDGRL